MRSFTLGRWALWTGLAIGIMAGFSVPVQAEDDTCKQQAKTYQKYIEDAKSKVVSRWNRKEAYFGKDYRIVASSAILPDGKLESVTLKESSGSEKADNAVKTSFQEVAPFAPLPPGCNYKRITLEITFDVHGKKAKTIGKKP